MMGLPLMPCMIPPVNAKGVLQIAICDDEQFYRRKIEGLLRTYLDGHGLLWIRRK